MTKHAVYRQYDAYGRLLYVGLTGNLLRRLAAHEEGSPWIERVTRVEIAWYDDRRSAAKAERGAIEAFAPPFNVPASHPKIKQPKGCEPAASIMYRLGGRSEVARMIGVGVYSPSKWTATKEKGGTGGIIPHWHVPALIEAAAKKGIKLTGEDFLPRPLPVEQAKSAGAAQ